MFPARGVTQHADSVEVWVKHTDGPVWFKEAVGFSMCSFGEDIADDDSNISSPFHGSGSRSFSLPFCVAFTSLFMGPLTATAVVVSSRRASNGVSSAICLASGECFSEERAFAAESTENCCQAFPGVGVIKGRRSVTFGTEDTSIVLLCSIEGLGDFDFLVFPFCLPGIVRNGGEGGFWGFCTLWFSASRLAG